MRSLISIVGRNMKVISRSKLSTFLVLLAPILIVFLIGSAFSSNSLNNIKIGVYSSSYSELTESIITNLADNQYKTYKVASEELCVSQIKSGETHACVVFPGDLTVQGSNTSVLVYADNSRLNLAYTLINDINSKISSKGSELGINMINDILNVLKAVRDSLPTQKTKVDTAVININDISSKSESLLDSSNLTSQIADLNASIRSLEAINSSESNAIASDLEDIRDSVQSLNSELGSSLADMSAKTAGDKIALGDVSVELRDLITKLSGITAGNAENIISPIKTEVKAISKDSTNWKHLYPTLIALIVLLSGVVLSSSIALTERKERARFRNFMTPTSDLSFVLGAFLTGLIILVVQFVILFACTIIFTDLNILQSIGPLSLILLIISSVFLFLGLFIGYMFKSDETTILASISIAALLIFFSNTIIPVESIRGYLKYVAFYNPFYVAESLLKKIILFNEPLSSMLAEIGILVAMVVLFLVLCLFARKTMKKLQ